MKTYIWHMWELDTGSEHDYILKKLGAEECSLKARRRARSLQKALKCE